MSAPASPVSAASRHSLVALTWPLLAELVLGMAVGIAGLWLASRVSDSASGAFALSNHVQVSFFLLFRIISMGVSVVISQNLGAGDRASADLAARAALAASTWLGLGAALALALFATPLLRVMNAPDEVLPLAAPYLRILAISLALDAFNASMAAVMRAHMHARDTLYNMLAMHGLHLALSLPLMPVMGLAGYAVAAAVSRAFGLGLHLLLWRWRLQLVPHGADWWRLHWGRLAPVLHIGLPGAAENIAYRLALMVTIALAASMGTHALATHSYTMQIMYFILVFGLAIGFASEILVGHMVGARQLHAAHALVRKSVRYGLLVSTGIALLAALAGPWLMRGFTQDETIIAQASTLLWITVLLEPGRTFNLVVINALRATGDARFPVVAGIASMVFVMAGGAWLLGSVMGLGLVGVWIAYAADEWVRGLTMCARWWRRGWVPAARATHRRLTRQRQTLQL
ncbi:MAG TPA: MATE family efflux transporter [Rhizobacter sp.]